MDRDNSQSMMTREEMLLKCYRFIGNLFQYQTPICYLLPCLEGDIITIRALPSILYNNDWYYSGMFCISVAEILYIKDIDEYALYYVKKIHDDLINMMLERVIREWKK